MHTQSGFFDIKKSIYRVLKLYNLNLFLVDQLSLGLKKKSTLLIFESNLKFKYQTDSTGSGGAGTTISGSGPVEHFLSSGDNRPREQVYGVGIIWSPD